MSGEQIVAAVTESGLRGRGGAAFPTGIKWKTVLGAPADQKYVVCNADEGDSGTFADRMIMESDPYVLIEGMTIAGLAVGATRGFVYIRCEYPQAIRTMREAVERAKAAGFLGERIQGGTGSFHLEVREAAGAYICGEETSLLESLEGKRGMVRYRPPLPAIKGLFGKPSIINNVMSLASVPIILDKGAAFYKNYGSRPLARHAHDPARRATSNAAGSSRSRSGCRCARSSTTSGVAAPPAGRSRPCRPAGRSGLMSIRRSSIPPLDYEQFAAVGRHGGPRRARGVRRHGGYGRAWPGSRWSSARSNRAENALLAASGPCAESKSSIELEVA